METQTPRAPRLDALGAIVAAAAVAIAAAYVYCALTITRRTAAALDRLGLDAGDGYDVEGPAVDDGRCPPPCGARVDAGPRAHAPGCPLGVTPATPSTPPPPPWVAGDVVEDLATPQGAQAGDGAQLAGGEGLGGTVVPLDDVGEIARDAHRAAVDAMMRDAGVDVPPPAAAA